MQDTAIARLVTFALEVVRVDMDPCMVWDTINVSTCGCCGVVQAADGCGIVRSCEIFLI